MTGSPSVDNLFERKDPQVKTLYDRLLVALCEFGDFTEVPKSNYLLLKKKSNFAGVYPRKNYFNLEFLVNHPIGYPRIVKALQLSAHRFAYTVKIESESDIDVQLLQWLKDAYEVCK